MQRFNILGGWYYVITTDDSRDETKPFRLTVYDFSGILIYTVRYKFAGEIEGILADRFKDSLQCKYSQNIKGL